MIDRQGRKRFTLNPIRAVRCAYAANATNTNAMLVEEASLRASNLKAVTNRYPKRARRIKQAVNLVNSSYTFI